MPSPSNIYAEKAFSEHPISMWALDDVADYVSLIPSSFRAFHNSTFWTATGATVSNATGLDLDIQVPPFPGSALTKSVTADNGTDKTIEFRSDFISNIFSSGALSFDDLNQNKGTICIGTYVYSQSEFSTGYEIGYTYFDSVSGESVDVVRAFDVTTPNRWLHVSATFPIPEQDVAFKLIFRAKVSGTVIPGYSHTLYYNGLTLGQWSEEFCSTSLGSEVVSLPAEIDFLPSGTKGIVAGAYAREDLSGYYLVNDNTIHAKNSGVPLIYGAANSTVVYPNEQSSSAPSVIVPGMGFLNNSGRYRNFTLEFWANINSSTYTKKRVLGPVASSDGLYVDGPFIGLKIGSHYASHYIGEWARPMLIHIRYISDFASLLINGEEVLSFSIKQDQLDLPDAYDESGSELDWIGVYAHEDVSPISIDCVAIYGYQVSSVLAKRRFVYGQGVEFPENINSAYSGTTAFFDYSFAKYPNNYIYPDSGSWNQGIVENVNIDNGYLQSPQYEKPEIVFNTAGNSLYDSWLSDLDDVQQESDLFVSLKPKASWNSLDGYLYFKKYQLTNDPVAAFYGVFKVSQLSETDQVLFRIDNQQLGKYFEIVLVGDSIKYRFKDGLSSIVTLYESSGISPGNQFTVGISVKDFVSNFGTNLRSFFANPNQLSLYVAGTKEFTKSFTGKIYSIGLCTVQNLAKIPMVFSSRGVPVDYENVFDLYSQEVAFDAGYQYFGQDGTYWQYLLDGGTPTSFVTAYAIDHLATYTFKPTDLFGKINLSIGSSSYWEDYLPLTYFAKYVEDVRGNQRYDLDFIQFNIDYPAPAFFKKVDSEPQQWTYSQLYSEYSVPTKKTYELLSNHLFTGYDNYSDLSQKSSSSYVYDTDQSIVRTYVMFSYTSSVGGFSNNRYSSTQSLPKNGIVSPGDEWMTTRYEVVNNSIIYPPQNVDLSKLAMITQVEMSNQSTDINTISIRSIQYASQSLESISPTKVGTRFGAEVVPYRQEGFYTDYAGNNPFTIYKGSTPYLYNTRYSGIQVRGNLSPLVNRGLSLPINPSKSANYEIIAMQLLARYDEDFFPISPTKVFDIQGRTEEINVFLVATSPSGKRAKLYAVNAKTGRLDANVAFYLNGKLAKDATLNVKEWATLGISFSSILDVSLTTGAIKINGPLLINNISYYQSTSLQEQQETEDRVWQDVLEGAESVELEWDFWDSFIWNDVLVLTSTSLFGVNPAEIYKSYTGTNKIIIDDYVANDDAPNLFVFNGYEYRVYSGTSWSATVRDAL